MNLRTYLKKKVGLDNRYIIFTLYRDIGYFISGGFLPELRGEDQYRLQSDDIFIPAATDCGDGFEAAWGELGGACVAAIHSPVE